MSRYASRIAGGLWRESATLMIVGRNALIKRSNNFDYKVLLLQRSPKSRFMPGNYVFPGGVIENVDFDVQWMDLYHKSGADFSSLLDIKGPRPPIFKKSSTCIPSEVAFRICAIRETFEESGVLLLKKIPDGSSEQAETSNGSFNIGKELSDQEIGKWRSDIHNDPTRFIELCRYLDSVPDIWSLSEWANWLTPADMKIRFDAAFFICFCEEQPTAQHDDQETVHSQWKTPIEIVMDYYTNKTRIGPPQLYTLLQLCRITKWNELKNFQEDRAKEGMIRILPIRVKCRDAVVSLLPGDDMYPRVLDHVIKVTNNEYGIEQGIVSQQVFPETCKELEEGIVNFHRNILKRPGNHQLKVNCSVGNRMLIPLTDVDKLLAKCTGTDSKL